MFEQAQRLLARTRRDDVVIPAEKPLEHYGLGAVRLRNVSLFTAVLMEQLAKYAGANERQCYTLGLLRSIGMMTLQAIARQNRRDIPTFDPSAAEFEDIAERAVAELRNRMPLATREDPVASIPRPPELRAEPPYIGSHAFVGRQAQLESLSD